MSDSLLYCALARVSPGIQGDFAADHDFNGHIHADRPRFCNALQPQRLIQGPNSIHLETACLWQQPQYLTISVILVAARPTIP